jgi:hypothetical protein
MTDYGPECGNYIWVLTGGRWQATAVDTRPHLDFIAYSSATLILRCWACGLREFSLWPLTDRGWGFEPRIIYPGGTGSMASAKIHASYWEPICSECERVLTSAMEWQYNFSTPRTVNS